MATTLFNALSVKLSRALQDPAAYSTDGQRVTAANRLEFLNRANRYVQNVIWSMGEEAVNRHLHGLIATNLTATTSGYKALPSDYSFWLGFQKLTGGRATYVHPQAKPDLDSNANPNMTLCFTILGNYIYAYENGTTITNAAHPFYYIKNDQIAAYDGLTDIAIDLVWHDTIVDIATSFALTELGEADQANKYLSRSMEILQAIMKANNG